MWIYSDWALLLTRAMPGGIGVVQVSEEDALSASATSYGILSKDHAIF